MYRRIDKCIIFEFYKCEASESFSCKISVTQCCPPKSIHFNRRTYVLLSLKQVILLSCARHTQLDMKTEFIFKDLLNEGLKLIVLNPLTNVPP
jgi:hypothetical protein